MCQLNIYCVPKSVKKEKVLSLMNECMGYSVAECIDEENPVPSLKNDYSFYTIGGMRCNCDSLPCKFQYENNDLTFAEQWANIIDKERARLNEFKEFMEQDGYDEKRNAFDKEYKKLSKKMQQAYTAAQTFERQATDKVLDDESLSDEQKNKLLHEEVYPEVNRLLEQVDRDERVKAYYQFLNDNALMWNTYMLTKKRAKKKKAKKSPVQDEDVVEIEIPSLCIYDLIDDIEKRNGRSSGEREYAEICDFIDNVLALTTDIKIICYWQDGEELKVNAQKTINRKDMTIESLIYLKHCELLTIEK